MKSNDVQADPVLASLRELQTYDVRPARAQRLRGRCHRALQTQTTPTFVAESVERSGPGMAPRVIAGAWCAVYLFETIRRAAEVYAF